MFLPEAPDCTKDHKAEVRADCGRTERSVEDGVVKTGMLIEKIPSKEYNDYNISNGGLYMAELEKIKESIYKTLLNPTRENFADVVLNGVGEQDNLDFKEIWNEEQKIAEIIIGMANIGGGAIIFGVRENDDGTLEPIGLSELKDREKIDSKIKNFLPDSVKMNIVDFDFTNEMYERLGGRLYQIIIVYSNEIDLPYVWKKNSNDAEQGCIYYRRGTKTVKANPREIKEMIDKRVDAELIEHSNLELEEHLKQLETLYKYINPMKYTFSIYNQLSGNIRKNLFGGALIKGVNNPNYPKESYEDFVVRMIARKKEKIERVLDLK